MRYSFLAFILIALALALNFEPVGSSRTAAIARQAAQYLIFPFQSGASFILSETKGASLFLARAYRSQAKIDELSGKLKEAHARIMAMGNLEAENQDLKYALNFVNRSKYGLAPANVVGRDEKSWNSIIVIDAGERKGVRAGLTVISSAGLVGKVIESTAGASKVILVTSPQSLVSAHLPRDNLYGIAYGTGQRKLNLRYIPETASVEAGDPVVVSGGSRAFMPGILVGHVLRVEKSFDNVFQKVEIEPAADLSKIGIVFVCKPY